MRMLSDMLLSRYEPDIRGSAIQSQPTPPQVAPPQQMQGPGSQFGGFIQSQPNVQAPNDQFRGFLPNQPGTQRSAQPITGDIWQAQPFQGQRQFGDRFGGLFGPQRGFGDNRGFSWRQPY